MSENSNNNQTEPNSPAANQPETAAESPLNPKSRLRSRSSQQSRRRGNLVAKPTAPLEKPRIGVVDPSELDPQERAALFRSAEPPQGDSNELILDRPRAPRPERSPREPRERRGPRSDRTPPQRGPQSLVLEPASPKDAPYDAGSVEPTPAPQAQETVPAKPYAELSSSNLPRNSYDRDRRRRQPDGQRGQRDGLILPEAPAKPWTPAKPRRSADSDSRGQSAQDSCSTQTCCETSGGCGLMEWVLSMVRKIAHYFKPLKAVRQSRPRLARFRKEYEETRSEENPRSEPRAKKSASQEGREAGQPNRSGRGTGAVRKRR